MVISAILAIVAPLFLAQTAATSTSVSLQLQKAASLQQSGDLADARDIYQSILTAESANVSAQTGEVAVSERLALEARSHGNNGDALRSLLEAQQYVPDNPRLLYDTGVLEDGMKLYWDADKTVLRLRALPAGGDPGVLYLAARIKMDLGQLAPAEQDMRAYLKAKPEDATAHYGLGRILQLGEHFDAARTEFLRSLALQPQQTESQFQLGEIALAQGRDQDAIDEYEKTLAGNPKHGGALAGTGIAYFHLKQYDKAEAALTQSVAAAPDYQPAHYYLGLTLARLGHKDEAQRELAKAAAMAEAQNQQASQRMRIEQAPAGNGTPPR